MKSNFKANLYNSKNFTPSQLEKINKSISLIVMAVNTDEFKERVLNYKHRKVSYVTTGSLWWKKTTTSYQDLGSFHFESWEKKLSNEQILNLILEGREEETPEADGEMDLDLSCVVKLFTSATAYGYAGSDPIVIYSWWVNQSSIPALSNTIFHEWLHNIGLEHSYEYSEMRDAHSAPYAIGDIVQDIITKKIKSGEFVV